MLTVGCLHSDLQGAQCSCLSPYSELILADRGRIETYPNEEILILGDFQEIRVALGGVVKFEIGRNSSLMA